MAAALEQQADAMDQLDKRAVEASEALQASRAALSSGRLDEARAQSQRAKELFSGEGLGEAGSRGLAMLRDLETELGEAETKAGLVREGLQASIYYNFAAPTCKQFAKMIQFFSAAFFKCTI